jgi:MFS family permease
VLGAGVFAQTATCMFQFGVPYLLPQLRVAAGGSLSSAALLVACPSIGLVLALIAWGAFADRHGERRAMIYGLIGAAIILGVAGTTSSTLALGACLIAAGAMGPASAPPAGGRSWDGSARTSAGSQWEYARPASRSASAPRH